MIQIVFISLMLALTACTHQPLAGPNGVPPMEAKEYARLIKNNTARTDQYSGFYQTFQADSTILSSEVMSAVLRQKAIFLQWDQRQYQSARDKATQEANAFSKFFLRFYAANRDYDDLARGKTIWKVFLDYSGSRFEGKVSKMTEKFVEVQNLYPYMDGFSSAYEITFNVPMTTIEQGEVKMILTSSLGHAEFVFPTKK